MYEEALHGRYNIIGPPVARYPGYVRTIGAIVPVGIAGIIVIDSIINVCFCPTITKCYDLGEFLLKIRPDNEKDTTNNEAY
jgi:hypothetical protein